MAAHSGRYSGDVDTFDLPEAAQRGGVGVEELARLVELGVITPDDSGRFRSGHLRRMGLVKSLVASGIPLEGLGAAIRGGSVTLDFLDAAAFERFSAFSGTTFAELAEETGVPVDDLMFIREASGSVAPQPEDQVRDEELPFIELFDVAAAAGMHLTAIQRMVRAQSDSMRRIAETESAMWQAEVIHPAMSRGMRPDEILGSELGDRMSTLTERSVLAMYHLQQARAWTENLIEGVEMQLDAAGLHSRLDHPPAMCFLDISGYTRLTQEHGDAAAALLAEKLGGVVRQTAIHYGGRPVKWLGDGVMLHFPNPGSGVVAALDMVDAIDAGGLPPAHVGLHAGPVIFQEGDYYGQTVNLASRIADYAQAGEVIVSRSVVDAAGGKAVAFSEVGPVELKGVAGALELYAASRPA
jgi:adenylate cyclase